MELPKELWLAEELGFALQLTNIASGKRKTTCKGTWSSQWAFSTSVLASWSIKPTWGSQKIIQHIQTSRSLQLVVESFTLQKKKVG